MFIDIGKHPYRYLLSVVLFILILGTVFYHFVEGLSWLNAYYFCVVTLATIGYGDITPKTDLGKLFTTFYIFAGVGVITSFFTVFIGRWKARVEKRQNHNHV